MATLFRMLLLLFVLQLTGCLDYDNRDETPPSHPGNNADLPPSDSSPPIARLVPDSDGTWDPFDQIIIEFDEAIDPTTVPEIIVGVSAQDGTEIEFLSEYNASRPGLLLTPLHALREGAFFVLKLDGIADADGNAISTAGHVTAKDSSDVSTLASLQVALPLVLKIRPRLLKDVLSYNSSTGELERVSAYRYHASGKIWRTRTFISGPGPDGVWLDGNDKIDWIYVDEKLDNTRMMTTLYDGPGDNGVWDAGDDDEFFGVSLVEESPVGGWRSELYSMNRGADAAWFSEDDVYGYADLKRYMPDGRKLVRLYGSAYHTTVGPGIDGDWFTDDDGFEYYTVTQLDAQLRPLYVRTIIFRGDDEMWFSPDDVASFVTEYQYDDLGRLIRRRSYHRDYESGAGYSELMPSESFDRYDYLDDSRWPVREVLAVAGEDGEPGGGDDQIIKYKLIERDALERHYRGGIFGYYKNPGPDETWFTSDDVSNNSWQRFYDHRGLEELSLSYSSLGIDGVRYSGDEPVSYHNRFEYDEKGRMSLARYYTGPPGAQWPDVEHRFYTGPVVQ